jgi:cytidine deaminase
LEGYINTDAPILINMKTCNLSKEDKELIKKVIALGQKSRGIKGAGEVGAIVVSSKGNEYFGVCAELYCGIGTCAEHGAACQMLANGENKIKTAVAVYIEKGTVMPPCGRCRELFSQLGDGNLNAWIIISNTKKARFKDLIPFRYTWKE